jgi:hypothetical protein
LPNGLLPIQSIAAHLLVSLNNLWGIRMTVWNCQCARKIQSESEKQDFAAPLKLYESKTANRGRINR